MTNLKILCFIITYCEDVAVLPKLREGSINWDVAFVVHILVGIVAAFMYKEYEVDSHVDSVVL